MLLQNQKKKFKNLNITIPVIMLLLIVIGLVVLASAVEVNKPELGGMALMRRQLFAILLGIVLIISLQFIDYRVFKHHYRLIFLVTVLLLVYILFAAEQISGARRWINLAGFRFQPSELAKIFFVFVMGAVLENREDELKTWKGFMKPFFYLAIPFVLIVLQNDLGTAMVLIAIFLVMMYIAGANRKYLLFLIGGGVLLVGIVLFLHIFFDIPVPFLHDYQLDRLLIFLNPESDPGGRGYNIIQSLIAVGSGGLLGKGWFAGTQNQLNFLPEKHTDFIFSVFSEEFGFLGVIVLLSLYFLLLWQFVNVALQAKDRFGKLIISGIIAMLFFHVFENAGMAMGLMPITGIPLPFISYGGSSMVAFLVGTGIVLNVNLKKRKLSF